MNDLLNLNPSIDLKQCVLWQYVNSFAIKNLILSKENWYKTNNTQFWLDWYNNVFNLQTANDFGLSVWGEILNFPRNVLGKDGLLHYLTTEQYRLVLKGEILKFGMGATVPEMNNWLSVVFAGKGSCFCLDNLDMTAIPIVFRAEPDEEIKWLLSVVDFFPRPAGVGYQIRIIPNDVFGFNGSGLQPFNQGVFSNDYSDILNPPEEDSYQISINAPEGATVKIDGETKNWALIEKNESYTWEVTQNGYLSASGSGIITQDILIDIGKLTITSTSGEGSIFINNQTAYGAFFVKGIDFSYSYNIGKQGYIGTDGNGVIKQDRNISISRLLINSTPSDADIIINGISAKGAFFETGTEFEYTYTVTSEGMLPVSDSGIATQDTIINAQALSGEWVINNIQTTEVGGVSEIGMYTIPADAIVGFRIAAEQGRYNGAYNGGYGAMADFNLSLRKNDVLLFKKISGGFTNISISSASSYSHGGSGVALYVNNVLRFVVGGGAGVGNNHHAAISGGGGLVGGVCVQKPHASGSFVSADNMQRGYSLDGSLGNSFDTNLSTGCGKNSQVLSGVRSEYLFAAYGGSGVNYIGQEVAFNQNFGAGFVKLTITPN